MDSIVKIAGEGAQSCVKMTKCLEGQFNKVFTLTLDNGKEFVAKIPNPNAGPEFYTIASEIATRHFLREVLNIPIPHIYASSSNSTNSIGTEYIIEEKAIGKPLGSIWYQWSEEEQMHIVQQIVEMENKLASIPFRKHGCIYYKKDLESKGLIVENLKADIVVVNDFSAKHGPLLEQLVIGPLTERRLWEEKRKEISLDRGPWNNPLEYIEAMGSNEIQWTKCYAQPRTNSMENPESPDEYLSLLERYLRLTPYLVPTSAKNSHLKTLSHPDLHLDNIFVDPVTKKITAIIDWQSTAIKDIFLQCNTPPMFQLPEYAISAPIPDTESSLRKPLLAYEQLSRISNPERWIALHEDHLRIRTKPISMVIGAWENNDLFSFRHSLIEVIAHWSDLVRAPIKCPISFTEEELELHGSELELMEGLSHIMHQLQDVNMIPLGGMVPRTNYEQAKNWNRYFKEMFINLGEGKEQRALHAKVWPYQDL
ncbi:MAG: Phosphotransferase enzyme [Cirrosporium novae-zelandiae]|nr:MAG: Phosphotransferase enzyme [Cirrosporium novae-zelandiae]